MIFVCVEGDILAEVGLGVVAIPKTSIRLIVPNSMGLKMDILGFLGATQ